MYKRALCLLLLLLISACGSQSNSLPTVEDIEGNSHVLSELDDKWLVINYWASWCKPCYTEIPELNSFQRTYAAKVAVLGVSYDQVGLDDLPQIVEHMQINFPTLKHDPAKQLGINAIPGLPATFIFSPQGKLVKSLFGPQTNADLAEALGFI